MSFQDKSNANIPSLDWISGIDLLRLLNLDGATFVFGIRSIDLKQNGIPSFDIWTGQSRTSAPSEKAFSYAKSVQGG